jgi:hypothetical protein
MKPAMFKEANIIFSDKEKKSLPMPTFRINKTIVACWKMNLIERIRVLFKGRMWVCLVNGDGEFPGSLLTTQKSELLTVKKNKKINSDTQYLKVETNEDQQS